MKYLKIFMLAVAAVVMASCSSDDDSYNTIATTNVGFTNNTVVVKENSGYFNVPITISGERNGDIKVIVEAEPCGPNPAVEDQHYLITSKTLTLLNDTTKQETLNVQIKTVDDQEINVNREFKLKITSVQGAQLGTSEVIVTLRDNDAAFFEKFFGKWTFSAIDSEGAQFERTITISGPSDEEDPDYNHILTATGTSFLNVGVALNFEWHFNYNFNTSTKTGTLGIVMGEQISSYGSSYQWVWVTDNGESYITDDLTAEWNLGEGDSFPTEIVWESTFVEDGPALWFYQPGAGWWERFTNVKITKQ